MYLTDNYEKLQNAAGICIASAQCEVHNKLRDEERICVVGGSNKKEGAIGCSTKIKCGKCHVDRIVVADDIALENFVVDTDAICGSVVIISSRMTNWVKTV